MSKKAMIVVMAVVLAISAVVVMAQDSGPGVINITLPDGKSVPVFTDGRLNAFDMAAPVVVYYTAANGNIVNPNYTSGGQPDMTNLNFSNANTLNSINAALNTSSANSANATGSTAGTTTTTSTQPDPAGLINHLEILAVDPATSNGNIVLDASVEDMLSLVTGQQSSLSAQGYSVNFDPKANFFWVQSPANFEGKVYTFAWPNNIFPTSLIGQKNIQLTTSTQLNAASTNGNATGSTNTTGNAQATTQQSSQPAAQPTSQPPAQSTPTY